MKLRACNSCGAHILSTDTRCPHCTPRASSGRNIALAALLGFAIIGCGDKDDDSASEPAEEPATEPAEEPASEPTSEPTVEPEYGVAE